MRRLPPATRGERWESRRGAVTGKGEGEREHTETKRQRQMFSAHMLTRPSQRRER